MRQANDFVAMEIHPRLRPEKRKITRYSVHCVTSEGVLRVVISMITHLRATEFTIRHAGLSGFPCPDNYLPALWVVFTFGDRDRNSTRFTYTQLRLRRVALLFGKFKLVGRCGFPQGYAVATGKLAEAQNSFRLTQS